MNTSANNNIESKNQSVYVTVSNGVVQDIFPDRETAIKDMHRHVYNTLVGCCGGKVEDDGETCCVVSYQDKERNDICMVVPFDPTKPDHREAYNAQRSIWHLPELPTITEVENVKDFSDTLADDLKAGDRVLSRHYGAQATVLGREWDKQRKAWDYRVKFDTMQRNMDGSEFNVTEFHRDGLTKNYDPATGRERVGNAEYYRETLLAELWGNDRTPRTVYGMEIFKPTDRRPSWLVVADIFSEPKEMTLREVCDMLAACYQEEHSKAA